MLDFYRGFCSFVLEFIPKQLPVLRWIICQKKQKQSLNIFTTSPDHLSSSSKGGINVWHRTQKPTQYEELNVILIWSPVLYNHNQSTKKVHESSVTLLTYELTDYYPYPITIMPVCILCNLVVFNWKYITFKHLEIRQQARYTWLGSGPARNNLLLAFLF